MCPRSGAFSLFRLFIALSFFSSAAIVLGANAPVEKNAAHVSFNRPPVEKIRSQTRDILKNPTYAPRKSLVQWLSEMLQDWDVSAPSGVFYFGKVIYWIFIIGCLLVAVTILAYFIYTIIQTIKNRISKRAVSEITSEELLDAVKLTYGELRTKMEEFARKGDFKNAIRYMMFALLRWLDGNRILAFDESKTNGDYIREFSSVKSGAVPFRRFALQFDYSIYGGISLNNATYDDMNLIYERICEDVGKNR